MCRRAVDCPYHVVPFFHPFKGGLSWRARRMQGRRFDRPTVGWACGITGEVVRDRVQRVLVGRPDKPTGTIPKDALSELVSARGIAEPHDTIKVHHVSGEWSTIGLKSYLSGREKFEAWTMLGWTKIPGQIPPTGTSPSWFSCHHRGAVQGVSPVSPQGRPCSKGR